MAPLPFITAKSVSAGTYVAEQVGPADYDLHSPTSGTKNLEKKTGRKGFKRSEPANATMLPALASLDSILGETRSKKEEDDASLPQIAAAKEPAFSSSSFFGRTARNDDFQQWLIPPRGALSRGAPSRGAPSRGAPSRGAPSRGAPSRGAPSRGAPSRASVSPHGEDELAWGTAEVPKYLWHVLLLGKTFDVSRNTVDHVADCLSLELSLDEGQAMAHVEAAAMNNVAKLASFESSRDAHRKMDNLLDHGLAVRLSKGLASLHGDSPRVPRRQYTDMFNSQKVPGRKQKLPTKLPSVKGANSSSSYGWRKKDKPITVLPEDPVSAFFSTDEHKRDGEEFDEEPPLDEKEGNSKGATSQRSSLSKMINKHRGTLQFATLRMSKLSLDSGSVMKLMGVDATKDGTAGAAQPEQPKPQCHLDPERKEACRMLRIFVFGKVGNEDAATAQEKNATFYEPLGNKEDVIELYGLWKKLDDDNSGRVDIGEFRSFAEQHMKEMSGDLLGNVATQASALPPMSDKDQKAFVNKLSDKLCAILLGKKSSFSIEDMMKILYPCAQHSDMRLMKSWCKEFVQQAAKARVNTPPVLPQAELDGLKSVFNHFDEDQSGTVSLEELITHGLIYEDQVDSFLAEWNKDGDEGLDLLEFCELMCPTGFRANVKSTSAQLPSGLKIFYDARMDMWREENDDDDS